jgi:O-antigen/teichoic acid export membrane protein
VFLASHCRLWIKQVISQVIHVVSLRHVDVSTPEGRSRERHRRVVLTALSLLVAKGITVLTMLISVPLTINYLGAERYGLWMTISSLLAILGFADLGIGSGLVNAISEADGKDDMHSAKSSVSSSFFMLLGIAVCVLLLFAGAYRYISWTWVFNVTSDSAVRESGAAVTVLIVCFAVNMPLGIVHRIQTGYQEGFASNLWQSVGSVMGLIGVLIAIYVKAGLPWLVLAMAGSPIIATALNWITQFIYMRPWLFPSFKSFSWDTGRNIADDGFVFFILQLLAVTGGYGTDNLVIAHVLGIAAVTSYSVAQKLYSIALITQFFVVPLWPAFGEALSRGELSWVRRTMVRSMAYSMGAGVLISFPFLFFGKSIIALWAGAGVVPTFSLLLAFVFLVLMNNYRECISAFFNSGPYLRKQFWFFALGSLMSFVLKIVLCHYWRTPGIVWAQIIAYTVFYLIPATIVYKKVIYLPRSMHACN